MVNTQVPAVAPKWGKVNLEVISCTSTEGYEGSGIGYILKLQHKETKQMKTPFGLKVSNEQVTFYMKVAEECKVGFKADLDIDTMRVVERPFAIEDTGEVVQLKWLHLQ